MQSSTTGRHQYFAGKLKPQCAAKSHTSSPAILSHQMRIYTSGPDMLRCFLYLVSQLTYIGGQQHSHSSELSLKSREILALCVAAFDPSTGQLPLCPALPFFSWVMMEVSHAEEVFPSQKWKIKSSSAVIVSALASVLFWKLIMLLLRDNLLLKQQLYLLPWKRFLYLRTQQSVGTPDFSSHHQCRWCLMKDKILSPHLLGFLRGDIKEERAELKITT